MKVSDYFVQGRRRWVRLHEKGGKEHDVPCHHRLDQCLHEYIESAGITLLKGDLTGIVRARRLSQATMRNIRQNLFFAFVFNALAVPIAAGMLYPFSGLLLNPMIASAAMSLSSVTVITNALRLRATRL